MNWYLKVLKNYFNFSGRARRKEYWMFTLFSTIAVILFAFIDHVVLGAEIGILGLIYSLAVFIPGRDRERFITNIKS